MYSVGNKGVREMRKLILLEWQKVKWPVMGTLIVGTALSMILSSTLYKNYALEYDIEAWELGNEYITLIFPLLAVMPTGWLMYYERKNNFLVYTLPRTSKKKYLLSKWIMITGSAGISMFIIMFMGVLTALYLKPEIIPVLSWIDPSTGEPGSDVEFMYFMGRMLANDPLLYGFIFSVWRGILAGIMATMAFVLSLYVRNIFIIITGPFIYMLLGHYIFGKLHMTKYSLVTSFYPNSITSMNFVSFIIGSIIEILFIIMIAIYFSKIKKVTIYPS